MPIVTTMIVEDHANFSRFLTRILERETQCQVIGQASEGLEAIRKAKELQPDLILLDLGLPKLNGIEVTRQVRKVSPNSKILIVSQDSSPEVMQVALREGAHGYLLKSDAADLPIAVDAVLQNREFVSWRR
jgi:DNA-binding NarL/FixJ family response regulator